MQIIRNNLLTTLPVRISETGVIGFAPANTLEYSIEEYGIFSCFPAGYNMAISKLKEYIGQFALLFNPDNDLTGELGGLVLLEIYFLLNGIGILFGI